MIKANDKDLAPGFWDNVGNAGMEAFRIVKARDFGLFDFRIEKETGVVYLLEVNLYLCFSSFPNFTAAPRFDKLFAFFQPISTRLV